MSYSATRRNERLKPAFSEPNSRRTSRKISVADRTSNETPGVQARDHAGDIIANNTSSARHRKPQVLDSGEIVWKILFKKNSECAKRL